VEIEVSDNVYDISGSTFCFEYAVAYLFFLVAQAKPFAALG
jgi:hypothetical protein